MSISGKNPAVGGISQRKISVSVIIYEWNLQSKPVNAHNKTKTLTDTQRVEASGYPVGGGESRRGRSGRRLGTDYSVYNQTSNKDILHWE